MGLARETYPLLRLIQRRGGNCTRYCLCKIKTGRLQEAEERPELKREEFFARRSEINGAKEKKNLVAHAWQK